MGGAFTAVSGDAAAVFWNPAGLARVAWRELFAGGAEWFAGMHQAAVAYVEPLPSFGCAAVGLTYLGSGPITAVDDQGGFEGEFEASDLSLSVGAGKVLFPGLSLGLVGKVVTQSIAGEHGSAPTVSGGVLYQATRGVSVACSFNDLGRGMAVGGGQRSPLPWTGTVGIAGRFPDRALLAACDLTYRRDLDPVVCAGVEWTGLGPVALRGGYRLDGGQGASALSAGLGFSYLSHQDYLIDYAFNQRSDLGALHFLSVGMRF
jgi:hypothetical protein